MSRSNNASKLVFALSAAIIVAALAFWSLGILGIDPLAGYKSGRPLGGKVGMQLNNVEMTSYDGDQLVASAHIGRVDVRQDRQFFELFDLKGTLLNEKGSVDFETQNASYDAISKKLNFINEARISNKDFDVTVPRFGFDENEGVLMAPGEIVGRAFGGQIRAIDLKYKVNDRIVITGPISWSGRLSAVKGQDGKPITDQDTDWNIESKGRGTMSDTAIVYDKGRATDGEILVKGDKIELDRVTDVITVTGHVYYFSDKANLVCDKAVVNRKEKKATLTGDIRMLVKPKDMPKMDLTKDEEIPPFKPDVPNSVANARPKANDEETKQTDDLTSQLRSGDTLRDYPLHVKATKVIYWYADGQRRAEIEGEPEGYQTVADGWWRRVTAYTAFYDGEKDTLTLKKEKDGEEEVKGEKVVIVKNSIGDFIRTTDVIVSTKEGDKEAKTGPLLPGSKLRGKKNDIPDGKGSGTPPPTTTTTTTGGGGGTTGG